MDIKYLIRMKNTPKIGKRENKGVSEIEIQDLEQKFRIKLPKAYKEFLYLAGKYDNIINNFELTFDWLPNMQEAALQAIQQVGLHLKPFWCFAEYNDAESSLFFFLDEGENPPVYNFVGIEGVITNEQGDTIFYKKTDNSFSECIDSLIDTALK